MSEELRLDLTVILKLPEKNACEENENISFYMGYISSLLIHDKKLDKTIKNVEWKLK